MEERVMYHEVGRDSLFKIWHASKQAMFIYMHSDGGSIVCSEKAYPIKKGTLCFVGANKYHYTMPDDTKNYDRSKIFISPDKLNKILDIFPDSNSFCDFSNDSFVYAQIDEDEQEKTEKIFEEMELCKNDERNGDLILYACCIRLMVFLNKYSIEKTPSAPGVLNKAIEYINSNIFTDIDVSRICSEVHISKYYFCRKFKENIGMTVMEYILKTRIVMAKNMLLKEDISVTEISNKCGFSSLSYFSRIFKKETGVTPLKYRKINKKAFFGKFPP